MNISMVSSFLTTLMNEAYHDKTQSATSGSVSDMNIGDTHGV
jgi:hypothetical protein